MHARECVCVLVYEYIRAFVCVRVCKKEFTRVRSCIEDKNSSGKILSVLKKEESF